MLLAIVVVLGLALALSFRSSPLPEPAALDTSLPSASPPAAMRLVRIGTGLIPRSAAFAYRGGSFDDARDFTMTAVLIEHPKGDILVDTGFGRDVANQVARMPFFFRAATEWVAQQPAADQLERAGYDRNRLRGILLTHAHWDHASGLSDFPGVPVLVDAVERRFIADGGWVTATAREQSSVQYEIYAFDDGPYLGFPSSHDVHGDGAIVVVPAPGHTPGSVIVFVALPTGRRYAFIGDLAWQREGITLREERPWLTRTLADDDEALVREQISRMAAVHASFPELTIVPAHDARELGDLPTP